jgi:hypothetical protein
MKTGQAKAVRILVLVGALAFVLAGMPGRAGQVSPSHGTRPEEEGQEIELRGKVVCLAEVVQHRYGTEIPIEHAHIWGFQASDGALYTLIPGKYSEALFVDERVRKKELLLKGRVFPKSHLFEVTRTRSIRDGMVYDLFYFCSVCNIESVSPGPCTCCRGPVELTEKRLKD